MIAINKNKQKMKEALLIPHEIEEIKTKKIKKTINDFWVKNKQKLLKYSLSDNDLNMNNIHIINKKEKNIKTEIDIYKINDNNNKINIQNLYKKKKNYSKNLNDLNLDINPPEDEPPFSPLFNSQTKNILSKILPQSEIEKYEKRYEYADIEKKNLLRLYSLENKKFLREKKLMKNQMPKSEQKFKLSEAKNDKLNTQLDMKEKEYEKLKNIFLKMKKELEDKKQKIKIMKEENILMNQKYQGIRDKYIDNNEKEKNKEKEKENEEEDGEEDEEEES